MSENKDSVRTYKLSMDTGIGPLVVREYKGAGARVQVLNNYINITVDSATVISFSINNRWYFELVQEPTE